jgi:hypothetical protein|tara:strand:+ start:5101 stop:5502 length:402 start_codon:yes stop_codon:yes gene_type:complete
MKTQLVDKALRKLIRQEIQAQSKSMSEDYKVSDKHTFKVTPNGGIILFGRRGKVMMDRDEIKNLLRGLKKNKIPESVNERVSSPFSQHLKDAQDEIEYMISEHPEAEEEGVYDKPKQAIKFLQVAQKALDKIT